MDISATSYKTNIDKAYILHLKIVPDIIRYLNGKPYYMIVSAIEHRLYGFVPSVWSIDVQFEGQYFKSLSSAEKALRDYFAEFDKKIEKGETII